MITGMRRREVRVMLHFYLAIHFYLFFLMTVLLSIRLSRSIICRQWNQVSQENLMKEMLIDILNTYFNELSEVSSLYVVVSFQEYITQHTLSCIKK